MTASELYELVKDDDDILHDLGLMYNPDADGEADAAARAHRYLEDLQVLHETRRSVAAKLTPRERAALGLNELFTNPHPGPLPKGEGEGGV